MLQTLNQRHQIRRQLLQRHGVRLHQRLCVLVVGVGIRVAWVVLAGTTGCRPRLLVAACTGCCVARALRVLRVLRVLLRIATLRWRITAALRIAGWPLLRITGTRAGVAAALCCTLPPAERTGRAGRTGRTHWGSGLLQGNARVGQVAIQVEINVRVTHATHARQGAQPKQAHLGCGLCHRLHRFQQRADHRLR